MKKNLIILLFSTLPTLFNCNKSHYSNNMESYSKAEITPFLLNYNDEKEEKSNLEEGSAFILENKIYNFGYNKKMYKIKSWPSYCKHYIMREMHDINYTEYINIRKIRTDRVLQIMQTLGVLKNKSKMLGRTHATIQHFKFNNRGVDDIVGSWSLSYLNLRCNAFKLIKKKFNVKHVNEKDEFVLVKFINGPRYSIYRSYFIRSTKNIWDPTPKVRFIKDKDDRLPLDTEITKLRNIICSIYNFYMYKDIIKLIILYKQIENYVDLRLCAHITYLYNKYNDNQYEYFIKKSDKKFLDLTNDSVQMLNIAKNKIFRRKIRQIKVLKKFWYAGIHSSKRQNGLVFYGKNKENKSYQPCIGQNETIYYESNKTKNSKLPKLFKPSKLTFKEIEELIKHKEVDGAINIYRKNKETNHIEKIKFAVINFVWHLTSFDEHGKATKTHCKSYLKVGPEEIFHFTLKKLKLL